MEICISHPSYVSRSSTTPSLYFDKLPLSARIFFVRELTPAIVLPTKFVPPTRKTYSPPPLFSSKKERVFFALFFPPREGVFSKISCWPPMDFARGDLLYKTAARPPGGPNIPLMWAKIPQCPKRLVGLPVSGPIGPTPCVHGPLQKGPGFCAGLFGPPVSKPFSGTRPRAPPISNGPTRGPVAFALP